VKKLNKRGAYPPVHCTHGWAAFCLTERWLLGMRQSEDQKSFILFEIKSIFEPIRVADQK
jgi:hypothetical protein